MRNVFNRCAVLAAFAVALPGYLFAGNTWDGGGASDNWSDGNNWNPNGGPGYGTLIFSGSTRLNNNNDSVANMNQIQFNSSSSFTIGGNTLNLFDNGGTQAKIEVLGSGSGTINMAIDFEATAGAAWAEINAVNGDLTFNNTVNMNGSQVGEIRMYGDNANQATFNGVITGGAGKDFRIMQYSIAEFNAVNTYQGETEIQEGELWIGENGDISGSSAIYVGNGGLVGNTAKLFLSDLDGGDTFDNNININAGNGTVGNRSVGGINSSGNNTFTGNINRNSDGNTISLTLYSGGGTVSFAGNITGDDSVLIDADGANGTIAYTSSAKTYSGGTFVLDGELRLDGNYLPTAVSVGETSGSDSAGLTIGVAGVTEDSAITVRSGNSGTMTLGGRNTSGTATFSGSVTLQKATTLTQYDAGGTIAFSGQISGNQALTVTGPGTVVLSGSGANDVSSVTLSSGTLSLNKTAGTAAIDANTTINGGTLRLLAANQISDSANVSVSSGGTFDLNSNNETVNDLNLASGSALSLGTGQIIVNAPSAQTWAGTISGSAGGSVVKKGANAVSITGNNSGMAGNWFIVAGTAGFNNNNAGGSGTIFLGETSGSDAATIDINSAGVSVGTDITVRDGSSGTKTIDNASGGTITFAGDILIDDNVTLSAGSGENTILSGVISQDADVSTEKIVKNGSGTVTLQGNNTYTGNTEIDAGTLNIAGDLSGSSFIYVGNGANSSDATLELSGSGSTLGGLQVNVSAGAGARTINVTAGTHTMSGSSMEVDRAVTINASAGSLNIAHNVSLDLAEAGGNEMTINATGGSVTLSGGTAISMGADRDLGVTGTGNTTISGAISASSGAAQINKSGSGTLTISGNNSGSSFMLNIAGGTVALNHANALGNTAFVLEDKVNFTSSGTLQANANAGSSTLDIKVGNGQTATIDVSGANNFSVEKLLNISGSGTYTKTGAGTLTIAGNSTFTGTFNQNAGVTDVQNNLNASSGVNVNGGTLNVDGTVNGVNLANGTVSGNGSINGNFVQNSGILSPGNSPGTLFVAGDAAWNGGSYLWEINDLAGNAGVDPGWDLVDITGTLTIGVGYTVSVDDLNALAGWDSESNYSWLIASADGGISGFNNLGLTVGSFNQNPYGGTFALNQVGNEIYLDYTGAPLGGGGDPSAVPEPNALSLTMLASLLLVSFRHKMRQLRRRVTFAAA